MTTGWTAAELAGAALAVFAVDPPRLGGVHVRGPASPQRESWLAAAAHLLSGQPVVSLPASATLDRVLGGIDLAATLASGTPTFERGLLGRAHDGVLVVHGAERMPATVAGPLAAAVDSGTVVVAREGFERRDDARFGMLLLDEAEVDESPPSQALLERCGLSALLPGGRAPDQWHAVTPGECMRARAHLPRVVAAPGQVEELVAAALRLGIASLRAPQFALHAARILAALDERVDITDDDLRLAAALVLAPRATTWPEPDAEPADRTDPPSDPAEQDAPSTGGQVRDRLVDAVRVALPHDLLAIASLRPVAREGAGGRGNQERRSIRHGRSVGSRPGDARRGRVDLLATLRAAAPLQRLRAPAGAGRLRLTRADIRVRRLVQKAGRTLVFVVDASGSSALQRLHEAKGAVETLLAESYVRRDKVALITFRGKTAELAVPPTRSLARARRLLAGLPGGGGTPLATALDAAALLGASIARTGSRPLLVVLTDARANVARDGSGGRPAAERDALLAAASVAQHRLDVILIDTSPRPNPFARTLAERMGGRVAPLPVSNPGRVASLVRDAVRQ